VEADAEASHLCVHLGGLGLDDPLQIGNLWTTQEVSLKLQNEWPD
jgi:hypothetical protein